MADVARAQLYPPIEPFADGRLRVSKLHEIYYEECGAPDGKPVVIVHGGPGGGCNPTMRRFHDPRHYRIVLIDQRGCGRSRPHAELGENTTWDLVADMERVREHLGLERWQLFGGSWGSTLSLAYAQTHPERVSELILRGIFTLRRAELEWFYSEGCSWLYPDAFARYRDLIPPDERSDMIAAYHRRLTHPDKAVQLEAAKAWSGWEGGTLSLLSSADRVSAFEADAYALAFARIECHYFQNRGFFDSDDQLIANVGRIRHIPGFIAHGRYDVVTPLKIAWDLKQAWPEVELEIIPDSGHAMTEPGMIDALVRAAQRFAKL